jgi:cell wall-associated NlpC family hydrolase
MNACFGKVKYRLGAKPRMGAVPGKDFTSADCSGFVRWLVNAATSGQTTLPDGSVCQHDWCKAQGFQAVPYSDAAKSDSVLRVAFMAPAGKDPGHVWLIINGRTVESYGGHGPGRRAWDTPVLKRRASACFVLTDMI